MSSKFDSLERSYNDDSTRKIAEALTRIIERDENEFEQYKQKVLDLPKSHANDPAVDDRKMLGDNSSTNFADNVDVTEL
jgi:hypothetical protein